jgi:hypothetical protein
VIGWGSFMRMAFCPATGLFCNWAIWEIEFWVIKKRIGCWLKFVNNMSGFLQVIFKCWGIKILGDLQESKKQHQKTITFDRIFESLTGSF